MRLIFNMKFKNLGDKAQRVNKPTEDYTSSDTVVLIAV